MTTERRNTNRSAAALLIGASLGLLPSTTLALDLYGLSQAGDRLFTLGTSGTVHNDVSVSGLKPGDSLVDIDVFASGDRRLYGLGTSGTLYTLDPMSGAATVNVANAAVGSPTVIDFNPAADRLRIFSGNGNYRLTPGTGVVSNDGSLVYAAADANAGAVPNLVAAAYINNVDAPGATTLFSLDAGVDALIRHSGGPQFSTLNTVVPLTLGGLPFDLGQNAGFDIFSPAVGINQAYVSNGNQLFALDLMSGILSSLGTVNASAPLGSIATSVPDDTSTLALGAVAAAAGMAAFRQRRREGAEGQVLSSAAA
jgi:hypothetical protein